MNEFDYLKSLGFSETDSRLFENCYQNLLEITGRIQFNLKGTEFHSTLLALPHTFVNFVKHAIVLSQDLAKKSNFRDLILMRESILILS